MPSRSTGATKLPRSIGWTCAYRKISRGWPSEKRKELREPPKLLELDRDANEKVKRVRDMTHCQGVVCVSVLGTGIFGDEPNIIHPIVRIHTVDATTGRYLKQIKSPGRTNYHGRASSLQISSPGGDIGADGTNIPILDVTPVSTAPCHLKGLSVAPTWNETSIVGIPYRSLLDPNVIILFEIVDVNHIQSTSQHHNQHADGVNGLAWAYLRPVGVNGDVLIGTTKPAMDTSTPEGTIINKSGKDIKQQSIQLQLYKYQALSALASYQARRRGIFPPPAPATSKVPAVYLQYLQKHWIYHTSTLLVRITPVPQHDGSIVAIREKGLLCSSSISSKGSPCMTSGAKVPAARLQGGLRMKRLETECYILPDCFLCRINPGAHGAMTIQFSPQGRLLAVAAVELLCHPIRLYDVTGMDEGMLPPGVFSAASAATAYGLQVDQSYEGALLVADLDGHHGMIYELRFTDDERYLLSASADALVKIWDLGALAAVSILVRPKYSPRILCVFHEPSAQFFYAAIFVMKNNSATRAPPHCNQSKEDNSKNHPRICPHVLTGSFNGAVAHWDPRTSQCQGLLGNRIAHKGRVHCLESDRRSGRVFSADSNGIIFVWRCERDGNHPSDFTIIRKIEHRDFKNKPIVSMMIRPRRRRIQLLVQAQASTLKLVDITTSQPVAHFKGNLVRAGVIRAKFSPDGTYVLAGSEDGKVYAWDTVSASPVPFLDGKLGYSAPLCDLSFHPKQHIMALTCFGGDHPVLVYCTNRPDTPKLLDGQASCDARTVVTKYLYSDHKARHNALPDQTDRLKS